MNEHDVDTSAGVAALVARLRDEGVEAGRKASVAALRDAEAKAAKIVADARAEADTLRSRARAEAMAEREAGTAALKLAARDATLALRQRLTSQLLAYVERASRQALRDPEFVRELILAVAAASVDGLGDDERARRVALGVGFVAGGDPTVEAALSAFATGLSRELLAEGIEVTPDPGMSAGIRLGLRDGEAALELTEAVVVELLRRHLAPRFAAVIAGGDSP